MSSAQPAAVASARPFTFTRADLALLVVITAWGTNYTVVKEAMEAVPALAFMAARFVLATAVMLTLVVALEGWKPLSGRTWAKLLGLGLVGNTAYQLCFFVGLSHTTAANSGMLACVTPVLVAGLAAAFGVERLSRAVLMGLGFATVGAVLVVSARNPQLNAQTRKGDLIVLVAGVCWAIYTVGLRSLPKDLSALRVTALAMLTGMPGLFLLGASSLAQVRPAAVPTGAWVALLYSALVPLVLSYVLWSRSVQVVGSSRTAIYNCGLPVVAAGTAWVVRGEQLAPLQILGVGLILAGVLHSRHRRPVEPSVTPSTPAAPGTQRTS